MADKLVAAPRVGGARTSTGGGSRTSNAAVGDYKGAPTATAFAAPFVEEGAGIKLCVLESFVCGSFIAVVGVQLRHRPCQCIYFSLHPSPHR